MTSKSISTLVDDIYSLFKGPHKVSDEALEQFKETVGEAVKTSLEEAGTSRDFSLRMSNIGIPNRKLYLNSKNGDVWIPEPKDSIKFLYGHIIEALILFLAKESGHKVENEQAEVNLEGIEGHIDCIIDGVVVDVKSASTYSFTKFTSGNILNDDPFGYRHQLSGYYEATETPETEETEVGWLVADKQHGELAYVNYEHFELPSASERIKEVKEVLSKDELPEPCYEPTEDKHGNLVLPRGCIYCTHKSTCWPTMRVFKYASNNAFYVDVKKLPRVPEITERYFNAS